MDWLLNWFEWLRDADNRGAVQVAVAAAVALVAWTTGLLGWLARLIFPRKPAAAGAGMHAQTLTVGGSVAGGVQQVGAGAVAVQSSPGATVIVGYTIEQHEARLARREAELRAELARAHAEDRAVIQAQLDEVARQHADLEASHEARRRELAEAHAALERLGAGLPAARLDEAFAALGDGDTGKADALFAEVEAMEAAAVDRAATAAFERGKLAATDIRWADAARHFGDAARLAPTYEHLWSAREYAWRAGHLRGALACGDRLIEAAVSEHGTSSAQHAAAMNEHAITLNAIGRHREAEPLYREALALHGLVLGREHPDYAASLNNLAELLRTTGRHAEAEPLYREALALGERVLGKEHPDHVTRLNNLAMLFEATGRYGAAEPLYREALALHERVLGKEHPDYAASLNNLAALLEATGRHGEAEPLHREALDILTASLGADHPTSVIVAGNLARLRREVSPPAGAGD